MSLAFGAYGASTVFMILTLVVFLILFFASWIPIERGRQVLLRPLRSLNRVRDMSEQAAETGTTLHFSPGVGGLNGQPGTAEALNGLTTLTAVSRMSARTRGNLVTTTDDSLTYVAAEDVERHEYIRAGRDTDFTPEKAQFITQQDPIAYMAGTNYIVSNKDVSGSVMLGRFGAEYLLAGDTLARRNLPQVAGSSQVEALPLMLGTAGMDNVLLGEEIYAAPAYLDREPARLASLQAQDRLRLIIIVLIIAGVIAASAGLNIGDYFLR